MSQSRKANSGSCTYRVHSQELILLPEKAIWWRSEHTLLLADLHLGKSAHFRKNGLNVPSQVLYDDLNILSELILRTNVSDVIVLGDLFHAKENSEWQIFTEWLSGCPAQWHLVKGNHDRLPDSEYKKSGIRIYNEVLVKSPFIFTHFPVENESMIAEDHYNLSGHIHPAIVLSGKANQHARLNCFLFGRRQGLLPAFGSFTGSEIVSPCSDSTVFAIAGDEVLQLPSFS